jgi:hypothetical protein
MPENAAHTRLSTVRLSHRARRVSRKAGLCWALSAFSNLLTNGLPQECQSNENTTKPNSFLVREIIQDYTFDTNIRLALNQSRKEDFKFSWASNSAIDFILLQRWNSRAAMPHLPG